MKRLLLLISIMTGTILSAQTVKYKVDDNSIVQDSIGNQYPASIWKALMMKGAFRLKPIDPKDAHTAFLLVQLSEEEKQKYLAHMPKPKESDFFKTGHSIKPFKTTDIQGNKINLKENAGKVTVLNFWFINCPPCRLEIPELDELALSYKDNDKIQFIAVALDDKNELETFLKAMPFHYQIIDKGQYIASQYGINSFPTHVIIDPSGKVYFHTSGLAPNTISWLKKSISELLEKPSTVAQ